MTCARLFASAAEQTKRFVDDGSGKVCGVETVRVSWEFSEESGGFELQEQAGSEETLEADLVFLAMGFTGAEEGVAQGCNLSRNKSRNFEVSRHLL